MSGNTTRKPSNPTVPAAATPNSFICSWCGQAYAGRKARPGFAPEAPNSPMCPSCLSRHYKPAAPKRKTLGNVLTPTAAKALADRPQKEPETT